MNCRNPKQVKKLRLRGEGTILGAGKNLKEVVNSGIKLMTIIKFPSRKNESAFPSDIEKDRYHVYHLQRARITGYYLPGFPEYPGINSQDHKIDFCGHFDKAIKRIFLRYRFIN